MTHKLNDAAEACYNDIVRHLATEGSKKWAGLQEKHSSVKPRQFWRLVAKAKQTEPVVRGRVAREGMAAVRELTRIMPEELLSQVPPAPIRKPNHDGAINVTQVLRQAIHDCDALESFAMGPPDKDGKRKIRNATIYAKAIDIRLRLVAALVDISSRALDLQRIYEFFDLVIAEIRAMEPTVAAAIVERLRIADQRLGWTVRN